MKVRFIARKDDLAGLRDTLLVPTIEVSDNLWFYSLIREFGGTSASKMLRISLRWLTFRVGLVVEWL